MTIAQLVHPVVHPIAYPAHSIVRLSRRAFSGALHRSVARGAPGDAALWRSIGVGIGFAITGFAMMASALMG